MGRADHARAWLSHRVRGSDNILDWCSDVLLFFFLPSNESCNTVVNTFLCCSLGRPAAAAAAAAAASSDRGSRLQTFGSADWSNCRDIFSPRVQLQPMLLTHSQTHARSRTHRHTHAHHTVCIHPLRTRDSELSAGCGQCVCLSVCCWVQSTFLSAPTPHPSRVTRHAA